MKKRLLRVACLLLAALLLLPLSACSYPGKNMKIYREDGTALHLSDFTGKPTVVCFWVSWNRDAALFMSDFEAMYSFYGERVNFLAVSLTDGTAETKETALRFVRDKGYTFPVYFDLDGAAQFTFEMRGIPSLLFSDRTGRGIYFLHSAPDAQTFQTAILDILSL